MEIPRHDPLTHRAPGGFQTIWLNVFGWGALVAAGLIAGVVVYLITSVPLAAALGAGVVAAWVVVRLRDRRRHLNSFVDLGGDWLDRSKGEAVVSELQGRGISASYEELTDEDETGGYTQRSIRCRQRDADAVRQIMAKYLDR